MPDRANDPAHAPVPGYLYAPLKANGGWKGFFHSNLFVALVIWLLSQAVVIGGVFVTNWMRMSQISEWKGTVDATLKRMDESDTVVSHYRDVEQDKAIADLQARMKKSEDEGRHWEVIETEHNRLTRDVEELRHGKK